MSEPAQGKRLEIDIADLTLQKLYPAHGWALNSQGVKLLWCPMKLLMARPQSILRRVGLSEHEILERSSQQVSFWSTFHSLTVCLRELHHTARIACEHYPDLEQPIPDDLDLMGRANELVPLYIDLSFVYLRRIADRLAAEIRSILFRHWKSVPEQFSNWITDVDRLESFDPLCDFDLLREALIDNTAWFTKLRGIDYTTRKKGVRDALEHRRIRMMAGAQKAGDEPPRYTVFLHSRQPDVDDRTDLVTEIPRTLHGFCKLMESLHRAIGVGQAYERDDFIFLVGNGEDVTGYWPQIGA